MIGPGPPNNSVRHYDYHAMHFSAKCGIAKHGIEIACRPPAPSVSVCLSATLVDKDHIGWKSWKLIARQLVQHLRSS